MTNAIIFDTETTGKNEAVLIEAAWIRLDSVNHFLSDKFNHDTIHLNYELGA